MKTRLYHNKISNFLYYWHSWTSQWWWCFDPHLDTNVYIDWLIGIVIRRLNQCIVNDGKCKRIHIWYKKVISSTINKYYQDTKVLREDLLWASITWSRCSLDSTYPVTKVLSSSTEAPCRQGGIHGVSSSISATEKITITHGLIIIFNVL